MNSAFWILFFIAFDLTGSFSASNYESVVSWDYGSLVEPGNEFMSYSLKLYAPSKPGNYGVVVFLGGLSGHVPAFVYSNFTTMFTATSNNILISMNKLTLVKSPEKEEVMFKNDLDWILANTETLFNSNVTPESIRNLVKPDLVTNGITLMTHSAGGHVACIYLNNTCGLIKKLVLLDPVDGADPFGIDKSFIIHPPNKLPFQIPTLVLVSELSQVSALPPLPVCAPQSYSNIVFYNALTGPRWYMNVTKFGHGDFLDDWVVKCCIGAACKSCGKGCDFDMYRENVVKAVSYFLNGVDSRSSYLLDVIQDPKNSKMFDPKLTINAFHDLGGFDVLKTGPFCFHT